MPDATMKPLILLDIDGVLNPRARVANPDGSLELVLSDAKIALVNRLAAFGRIAWVSTWPAEQTAGLESQLQAGERNVTSAVARTCPERIRVTYTEAPAGDPVAGQDGTFGRGHLGLGRVD